MDGSDLDIVLRVLTPEQQAAAAQLMAQRRALQEQARLALQEEARLVRAAENEADEESRKVVAARIFKLAAFLFLLASIYGASSWSQTGSFSTFAIGCLCGAACLGMFAIVTYLDTRF